MPDNFGVPPELLAQLEDARRTVEPIVANMQSVRDLIANMSPVADLLARQRSAMETIQQSYEFALRVMPPPETRQAIAQLARQFREQQLFAADLAIREPAAEQSLLDLLPQTPEETERVEQAAKGVHADPELSEKLRRIGPAPGFKKESPVPCTAIRSQALLGTPLRRHSGLPTCTRRPTATRICQH
jgi:hypothetical protein